MEWPEKVQNGDFVRGLPPNVRSQLIRLAQRKSYPAGSVIFHEGTVHEFVHLIVEGRVRLEIEVPQRGRMSVLTVGPGDVLAWSPLFGHSPMTATASAIDDVETLAFSGAELRQLCQSNHDVGYAVMHQLALALSRRLVTTRRELLNVIC
jgi:CRP-like cAMP-binding protein